MKDIYMKPQADVEEFAAIDVITTSRGEGGYGGNDSEWDLG